MEVEVFACVLREHCACTGPYEAMVVLEFRQHILFENVLNDVCRQIFDLHYLRLEIAKDSQYALFQYQTEWLLCPHVLLFLKALLRIQHEVHQQRRA